ncbi:MAG: hypothetical protein HQK65_07435 [Desulfamplus sp.]|nr:hypothetical protein [Desulfamplus sp.]
MIQARSYFEEFAANDKQKTKLLKVIYKKIIDKGFVKELFLGNLIEEGLYTDKHALRKELDELVKNNFLYYNPTSAKFKLQGKSIEIGLMLFLREVDSLE